MTKKYYAIMLPTALIYSWLIMQTSINVSISGLLHGLAMVAFIYSGYLLGVRERKGEQDDSKRNG